MAQVREVAEAVRRCLAQAGISDPQDVHYVQVKGPLLTPASIADADQRGKKLVTRDPNGSKPFARGATALGVALGLGEVPAKELTDEIIAKRLDLFSSVASTSAGGELKNCEILLFGNSPAADGDFRIGHAILKDTIDSDGVRAALASAGLEFSGALSATDLQRIVGIFAKADASPDGRIRGRPPRCFPTPTSITSDMPGPRLEPVIASITNDPAIFVSGGTEHQCAPGAAPIAAIVRV